MPAPKTLRETVEAEVRGALRDVARAGKAVEHRYSDIDWHFHGKPSVTVVVRGQERTLKFGEEFNRKTDLEFFVSQLVDELVAKAGSQA